MNNFKPRLFHIDTKRKLWNYFKKHAGWNSEMQCYYCAGIFSDDTAALWQSLQEEWEEDIAYEAKRQLQA